MPNYAATTNYSYTNGNNPMAEIEGRLDAISIMLSESILNTNPASLYPASIASLTPITVTLSSLTSSITTGSLVFSGSGTNVKLYIFTGAGTSIPGHAGWVSASLSA